MGIKFSRIVGAEAPAPVPTKKAIASFFSGPPVTDSKDLQRILAVPRRQITVTDDAMAVKWTALLSRARPECTCHERYGFCIKSLNATQGHALEEANKADGLLGPIGCGHGKTSLDILLPMVMNCKRAVLLIPANLRHQFLTRDYPQWSEHFRTPNIAGDGIFDPSRPVLHVMSYNELSQAKNSDILARIQPDLIIADEAHNLKAKDRARTKRFLRQFAAMPGTRFVALSGTMTTRSIKDYCLDGKTKVLTSDLRWVAAENVCKGDTLIGFGEDLGRKGKMSPASVEGVSRLRQPRIKITTTHGSVVCSTLHGWVLCGTAVNDRITRKWVEAQHLKVGDKIARLTDTWEFDSSREGGYLAGLLDGEGWVSGAGGQVGFGQKPGLVLERYIKGLADRGFSFAVSAHKSGVTRVLPNGCNPHMRLLGMLRPSRLMQKSHLTWLGKQCWGKNTEKAVVLSVETLPDGEVIAIQTSTATLIAEGFLTHNSHLAGLALKEATPLPVHYPTLESWATALDAVELPAPPGALEALCQPGEDVRSGFRRRLIETRGVVATEEASVGCSLVISERKIKPPKDIADKLKFIRDQEARPDGEELIDQIQVAAVARQMACGFFYRWQFRKGETPEQIEHWLDVRSKWRKELRNKLKTGSVGTDSEALLQAAASRWHEGYAHEGKEYPLHCKSGPLPVWASLHYLDWCRVRGTVEPHTVPVWVDDYLLNDAMDWAKTHTGIIWYQHRAVGYRLAQLSGMPHYGSGEEANAGIAQEKGDRTIIASIKAHGVGKNLQAFNDQLILSPPSDAAMWEQALSRTHRQGQKADEVTCDVYRHTPEMAAAVDGAIMRARYIYETTGSKQRLLYASTTFDLTPPAQRA